MSSTIEALGFGRSCVVPEIAIVRGVIRVAANDANVPGTPDEDAAADIARGYDLVTAMRKRVLDGLTRIYVPGNQVEFVRVSANPDPQRREYTVHTRFTVTTFQPESVAGMLDFLVEEKAQQLSVSYEITETREAELRARTQELAVADARNRAEAMARSLGLRLGKLVGVRSVPTGQSTLRRGAFENMNPDAEIDDVDGKIVCTAGLRATFASVPSRAKRNSR